VADKNYIKLKRNPLLSDQLPDKEMVIFVDSILYLEEYTIDGKPITEIGLISRASIDVPYPIEDVQKKIVAAINIRENIDIVG